MASSDFIEHKSRGRSTLTSSRASAAGRPVNAKWVSVWNHRPYSPFVMHMVTGATVSGFKKLFPSTITQGGCYWKEGVQNYFYLRNELSETVGALAKKTLEEPAFLYGFMKTSLDKAKKLNAFSKNFLESGELREKKTGELLDFVKAFSERFKEMYSYATVLPLLGYHGELLYEKTEEILRAKTADEPEKFAENLLALTRPVKRLKNQEQELVVLKLALKAKKSGLKTAEEIAAAFPEEIAGLREEFRFLSFDFCDNASWDSRHYANLVAEKAGLPAEEIEAQIALNESYEENASRDFENSCAELGLSAAERKAFETVRDLGFYKWARQYEFQQACYRAKTVLDELGKRAGLTTIESKYLTAEEWPEALRNPLEYKEKAGQRFENSLMTITEDGGTRFLEGESAGKEFAEMVFARDDEERDYAEAAATELKGTPACAGKAVGRVSVVNFITDVKKMRDGDVLVSVATTPELVPAMKRASAIVTDEGGVTCHAAIVSRELGVPCVVGTKIASKAFKDGDIVEVDANKGVIKKLR